MMGEPAKTHMRTSRGSSGEAQMSLSSNSLDDSTDEGAQSAGGQAARRSQDKGPSLEEAMAASLATVEMILAPEGMGALIFAAASSGDFPALKDMAEKWRGNEVLNWADEYGTTPLMWVSSVGNVEAVRVLVAAGVDTNRVDHKGWSALMFASVDGRPDVVRLLLVAGAEISLKVSLGQHKGLTALGVATASRNTAVIAILQQTEAETKKRVQDFAGKLLYDAAKEGDVTRLAHLIDLWRGNGEVLNWGNPSHAGGTPLMIACQKNKVNAIRLLTTTEGVDVNCASKSSCTPLIRAVSRGHAEATRALLQAPNIDVNKGVNDGYHALLCAARWDYLDVLRLLLAAPGIDINQADQEGRTALMEAAFMGNVEIARALIIASGINLNQTATEGTWRNKTAIEFAMREKKGELVSLLRAAGALSGAAVMAASRANSSALTTTVAASGTASGTATATAIDKKDRPPGGLQRRDDSLDSVAGVFKSDSHLLVFLLGCFTMLVAVAISTQILRRF